MSQKEVSTYVEPLTQPLEIFYLDSNAFTETAIKLRNPVAVGAFSHLNLDTFQPTTYLDMDLFRTPVSEGSTETYEDLIPFVLLHEETEIKITAQNVGLVGELFASYGAHEIALLAEMKSANKAGKLDKVVSFHRLLLHALLSRAQEINPKNFTQIELLQQMDLLKKAADQAKREVRL